MLSPLLSPVNVGQKLDICCSFVSVDDRSDQRLPEEYISASAGLGIGLS